MKLHIVMCEVAVLAQFVRQFMCTFNLVLKLIVSSCADLMHCSKANSMRSKECTYIMCVNFYVEDADTLFFGDTFIQIMGILSYICTVQ